jgi:hypothetical protein
MKCFPRMWPKIAQLFAILAGAVVRAAAGYDVTDRRCFDMRESGPDASGVPRTDTAATGTDIVSRRRCRGHQLITRSRSTAS